MQGGYSSWEEVRDQLVQAFAWHDQATADRVRDLLDSAADAARSGSLDSAAACLQDYRWIAVQQNLFRSWDTGIIVFGEAIDLLLRMAPVAHPPPAYRRLIDAKPSLSYETRLTPYQREFWYG